jgi:hypothetical protein
LNEEAAMARAPRSGYDRAVRHLRLLPLLLLSACVGRDGGSGGGGEDPGLPGAVFLSADVGAVGQAGCVSGTDGVLTIRASGTDIWDAADAFHLLHDPLG